MIQLKKTLASLIVCIFIIYSASLLSLYSKVVSADNSTITRSDIDKACEKYGIMVGKYWTYNYNDVPDDPDLLDEAAKKGFTASDIPYGILYKSSFRGNVHKGEYYYKGYRQCWGFAELLGREITGGKSPTNNWKRLNTVEEVAENGGVQVGDVIQSNTHTAMVVEVTGSEFKVIQCAGNGNNKITIDGFSTNNKKYTTLESIPNLKYVARYTNALPHTPTVTDITISAGSKSDITSYVLAGSTLSLNWEASNTSSFKMNITKDGTEYIKKSLGNSTSWTGKFIEFGSYECTIIPYGDQNNEGRSASIKFTVVPVYTAPIIDNLKVTYSGYKYIEVQGTITDPGLGNAAYEIGVWEGNKNSPSFHSYGHATVEGNTIKGIIPVVGNDIDSLLSKYLGVELTIGVKGIDTLNNSHYSLCKKTNYEYKYPVPSESKTVGNHTYYRFDQGYTWEDANNWAKNETNGHLVTIGSKSENDAVISLISNGQAPAYYIGGTIDDATGKWSWVDSSSFSYTNWSGGKPKKEKGINSVISISLEGWKTSAPNFMSTFGFMIEVENISTPLPTAYPTSTPTPKPTEKPKPKLDTKQARSIIADAVAMSYTKMKFNEAYRYDVNHDGISDLILTENDQRSFCLSYADSKNVLSYSMFPGNNVYQFNYSKKNKKLVVKFGRSYAMGAITFFEIFDKNKLTEIAFSEAHLESLSPKQVFKYTYKVNERKTNKSKYNSTVKALKLVKIKAIKKSTVTKKQTKIPSVLLSDAAEYLKKDIFGNNINIVYKDINKDGIKDCYFIVSGKKVIKGYKGIKTYGDNNTDNTWSDVGIVLESSSKGVTAKYYTAKEAKKLFN